MTTADYHLRSEAYKVTIDCTQRRKEPTEILYKVIVVKWRNPIKIQIVCNRILTNNEEILYYFNVFYNEGYIKQLSQ